MQTYQLQKPLSEKILQSIYRAIYPAKCLFCHRALDDKNAFVCKACEAFGSAPYPYNDTTKVPIHALKYSATKSLAAPMARAIHATLPNALPADCLIPVPLHENRLKARGFNQAALIALELSQLLKIPVFDALKRTRDTAPQHNLSPDERAKNLKGAISLKPNFDCTGKNILLIDDISTTGETAKECIKALETAEKVTLLVFARA